MPNGNGNLLKITAKATNSGLLMNKDVPTAEYPILRWKWKVDNVYEKGDIRKRQTDDSPLRIYVLFDEGPPYESFGERLQYNAMRTFYGKAAPRSALIYFWSSKELRPGQKYSVMVYNPDVDVIYEMWDWEYVPEDYDRNNFV